MTASPSLTLLQAGTSPRLAPLLDRALEGIPCRRLSAAHLEELTPGGHLLFAVGMDAFGPGREFYALVRWLRQHPAALAGCTAGVVVDGAGELYTKQAAQALVMAANLAGCAFPGKPLVEGTGSLYNQHILAAQLGLSWEETYCRRVRELAQRVLAFQLPRFRQPRILMLHASDHLHSNTVWMGRQILAQLPATFTSQEVSLQNGTIQDCRGCSYTACLHYAQHHTCFYGGTISQEVLPAIQACDAMLFLCPNYNDAVSANLMALLNRMTNLLVQHTLYDKYLFGIVVSGYSGSDLVAQQLLGTMCFNKTAILPGRFCLMQTAHDPGSVRKVSGIGRRMAQFAQHMVTVLQA